jgi:hypothetical protein
MQNCEAFLRRVQRHTNKQAVRAWPRAQDRAIRLLPVNTTTRRILQGFSFQLEVLAFLQVSQGERAMSRTPRPSSQHHTASSHSLPVAHALRSRFRSNHCACTRSANSTPSLSSRRCIHSARRPCISSGQPGSASNERMSFPVIGLSSLGPVTARISSFRPAVSLPG